MAAIPPRIQDIDAVDGASGASDAELNAVLSDYLESEEQLRLLLFFSANRDQEWTVEQLAEALGTSVYLTGMALEDLRGRGLVALRYTNQATYSYQAQCQQLDRVLRHMYSSEGGLIATTQQMNAHSMERLRSAAAKAFEGAITRTQKRVRQPPENS